MRIWCHNHKEVTEGGKKKLICLGYLNESRALDCPHKSMKASQSCQYPCMDTALIVKPPNAFTMFCHRWYDWFYEVDAWRVLYLDEGRSRRMSHRTASHYARIFGGRIEYDPAPREV